MKKMIASLSVLVLFTLSLTFGAFAESIPSTGDTGSSAPEMVEPTSPPVPVYSVPETIPLESAAILKAYALTLVKQITVQVYGSTVTGKTYDEVQYTSVDANPNKMAKVAGDIKLQFSAAVESTIGAQVAYNTGIMRISDPESDSGYSEASFSLFFGHSQFKLEQAGGVWEIPSEAYWIEMDFYQVPLVIPGMSDAYISTEDSNGNQNGWYNFRSANPYWTDRGVLMLTKEMTGRKGKLNITMKNGSKLIYNIGTGERVPTVKIDTTGFHASIKGVRTVAENSAVIAYEKGDVIISTSFTMDMWSEVAFPADLADYPIMVSAISTKALAENPQAKWTEINPYLSLTKFWFKAGQDVLIRFDYKSTALPLIGPGFDGKG